jgi:hypothetical protein
MFDELAAVNDGHTTEVELIEGLKDANILFKSTLSEIHTTVQDQIQVISGLAKEKKKPGVCQTGAGISLTILNGPLIQLIKRVFFFTIQQTKQEITLYLVLNVSLCKKLIPICFR